MKPDSAATVPTRSAGKPSVSIAGASTQDDPRSEGSVAASTAATEPVSSVPTRDAPPRSSHDAKRAKTRGAAYRR